MSHFTDPNFESLPHYSDQDPSEPPRGHDPVAEVATLRDFNAKLLERISEIRRRNFELSKLEDKTRAQDLEITQLREQDASLRAKLSKLTDHSWAKDLEIQTLKVSLEEEQKRTQKANQDADQEKKRLNEETEQIEVEMRRQEDKATALQGKIQQLEFARAETTSALDFKIHQLESRLAENETLLEDSRIREQELKRQHDLTLKSQIEAASRRLQETEAQARETETNLTLETNTLRADRTAFEKHLNDANEKLVELRGSLDQQRTENRIELRKLKNEAERSLSELQAHLQNDFQEKFSAILAENSRLKGLLEIEDKSAAVERKDLQKRQVQLGYLEQQLRQSAEVLQNDKARILHLSKALTTEISQTRQQTPPHAQRQNEERLHELMSIIKGLS